MGTNSEQDKTSNNASTLGNKDVFKGSLDVAEFWNHPLSTFSFPQVSKEAWKPSNSKPLDFSMNQGNGFSLPKRDTKPVYSINKQVHDNLAKLPLEYQVKTLTCPVCSLEVKSTPKNEQDMTAHVEKHFAQKLMCPISPCFELFDQRKQAAYERHVDSHFTNEIVGSTNFNQQEHSRVKATTLTHGLGPFTKRTVFGPSSQEASNSRNNLDTPLGSFRPSAPIIDREILFG